MAPGMSDVQLLFLVLAVLYGWECACWVRRGSVGFVTWLGRNWRAAHPGALFGNQRGGFVLAPPLPPLGTFFTANQFPLSLSPGGVLAFVATSVNPGWRPTQTGRFVPFRDLHDVRVAGRRIRVNGGTLMTAASPGFARHLADQLRRLARLTAPERETAIRELVRLSLDAAAVKRRWQEFQKQSRPVRWLVNALFVHIFVLAPLLIWYLGLKLSWPALLIVLLGLTVTTAVFAHRMHRKFYPQAEDERFTHTLIIALSPATAIRALDLLSRPLFEGFHPLTLAKTLLPKSDFQSFARRVLLDLRHPCLPVCPGDDPASAAAELHARTTLQQEVEQFLGRHDLRVDDLCRPPAPTDAACRAYCPRCGAQFTTAPGTCADCGGVALVMFAERR